MDWATRCVLCWRLSNTMDTAFCVEALEAALSGGAAPAAFNTDQGRSSRAWRSPGGCWRRARRARWTAGAGAWTTLKYEAVYLRELPDGFEAERVIRCWIEFYNESRPHSSLGGRTPAEAYGALAEAA